MAGDDRRPFGLDKFLLPAHDISGHLWKYLAFGIYIITSRGEFSKVKVSYVR